MQSCRVLKLKQVAETDARWVETPWDQRRNASSKVPFQWNVGFTTWRPYETQMNVFIFDQYHMFRGKARVLPGSNRAVATLNKAARSDQSYRTRDGK